MIIIVYLFDQKPFQFTFIFTQNPSSQMNNEPAQSFRVVYDVEKNKYFRVNKITGKEQLSSKTGKIPSKFDPQVTGIHYILRKKLNLLTPTNANFHSNKGENKNIQKNQTEVSQKINQSKKSANKIEQYTQTLLPKLKKTVSLTSLEKQKIANNISNTNESNASDKPSIFQQIRNKKLNAIEKFALVQKERKKSSNQFLNSMNKLILLSPDGHTRNQNRKQSLINKFKNQYDPNQTKFRLNKMSLNSNSQNSQRTQSIEKPILISVLDDSRLSSISGNPKKFPSIDEKHHKNTITKTEVINQLNQMEKEKQSLFSLVNKSLNEKSQKTAQGSIQKFTEVGLKAMDLKNAEQKQRLKTQLCKQKQSFLSFYPEYAFRENPRLIQEQKDRKINLKKLQQSYLEGNQKKFSKIYYSQKHQEKSP